MPYRIYRIMDHKPICPDHKGRCYVIEDCTSLDYALYLCKYMAGFYARHGVTVQHWIGCPRGQAYVYIPV